MAGAGQADAVFVAARLPAQGEQGADAVLEGLGDAVGEEADLEQVVTRTGVEGRQPADAAQIDPVIAGTQVHRGHALVGVRHGQGVGASAQTDVERLELAVEDARAGHAEAVQAVGAQGTRLGERGCGIVDVEAVIAAIGVEINPAADLVEAGVAAGCAEVEGVGTRLAQHRHRAAGGGGQQVEDVDAAAEQDVQALQRRVGDGLRAQAAQGLVGQLARAGGDVAGVVEACPVGADAAVDAERAVDLVERAAAGQRADAEAVVARVAEQPRGAGDVLHHHGVIAGTAAHVDGRQAVGAADSDQVDQRVGSGSGAQQVDLLQTHVVDGALQQAGHGHVGQRKVEGALDGLNRQGVGAAVNHRAQHLERPRAHGQLLAVDLDRGRRVGRVVVDRAAGSGATVLHA